MTIALLNERMIRYLSVTLLVLYDLLAVAAATLIAFILRFDYIRLDILRVHLPSAPLVLATYLFLFYAFRLYRYRWPFAGVEVFWSVFFANVVAIVPVTGWQMLIDGERMPRSIIVMTCILATALIGGQRVLVRSAARWLARERKSRTAERWREEPKRTIILGGEQGAVEVLSALANEKMGRYEVLGILDVDPRHHGTYLRGIKILGGWEMMHDLVRQHAVDEVIIALQHDNSALLREFMLTCCRHKVAVRMVPVTAEWLEDPSASRRQLRVDTIRVEDLLHRQSEQLPLQELSQSLTGKRILVTGAGGSIGSELCRQLCRQHPALLVILGHGENSIHQIRLELERSFPALTDGIVPVICDIRDGARVRYIIGKYRPQLLFHAAAHKHVPLMEENVGEAVNNNVAGTRNVIRAASACGVERLVLISTDKAVNPSSVMGATKFLCEELARAETERSATVCITVRFGNVLGSRGSVLPRFQEQILYGGPVTVTHPEMRRYFMTIPEAVSLVLRGGLQGKSGDLFVLNMGNPVRIVRLAEDLIRLSGMVPYRDIAIEYSGLRPGEKLTEELLTAHEQQHASEQGRLFAVQRSLQIDPQHLDEEIDQLLAACATQDDSAVLHHLHRLIPTFTTPAPSPQIGQPTVR